MNQMQQQVYEFHRAMGQSIGHRPRVQDAALRASLMLEETIETAVALMVDLYDDKSDAMLWVRRKIDELIEEQLGKFTHEEPLVEVIDGIADVLYVTFGTAIACGVDMEPVFNEVHRSNMLKAGGKVVQGKLLKPKGWRPPKIAGLLEGHEPVYET